MLPRNRLAFLTVTALSGTRLVLAAFFVWCALDSRAFYQKLSIALLVALFVSDFMDGPLARRWKVVSLFGFVLDGVGDRALYLSALLVMSERFSFPLVFTYLTVLRDLVLYAARSLQPMWPHHHERTRWAAKSYAGALRITIILYFLPLCARLFGYTPYITESSVILFISSWTCLILGYYTLCMVLKGYYALGKN